ncbi:MAG: acetoacetate--CoA ligase [Pseudomonadota bacterium]
MSTPIWSPSKERIESTLLHQFARQHGPGGGKADYDTLWQWSIDDKGSFWNAVWNFCGIVGDKRGTAYQKAERIVDARFFPETRLNFAENLLKRNDDSDAIIFHGEAGTRDVMSWRELNTLVSRLQQALAAKGIVKGDRVVGFVPNTAHTIAAMLAVTSLGGVWSSCSPDFGVAGVLDRFGQVEPKLMFCGDGYHYNGKEISSLDLALEIGAAIPSLSDIVVLPYLGSAAEQDRLTTLQDFVEPYAAKSVTFERVGFRDPLYIMFSSGTTGKPKCIVHSVGGTLLQHAKEHQLQSDVRPGDRLMYFTTCGWMMWNWQVSGLAAGATLVLYDGSPFYPDGNRLSEICEREQLTHFGTSAKYIDACAKADISPAKSKDLSSLRTILSTGSPLAAEGFDYIYEHWKSDVCLSSIAGGTDIIGCFIGGNPIGPVYRGACQKRHLGMDVRIFDSNGQSVEGEQGELVCVGAHPSMPIGFWNDPDGSRYHEAYFAVYDNVWRHGDWVELTPEGGGVFFGRSDATLNPGGVRIGTAEIYRQVERVDEVLEALVIGQNWDNDTRVVLFVRLRDGVVLDDALVARIKSEIRTHATPRHVPAVIVDVPDIPRTKSGKIVELAVRDIIHGREIKNVEALANPEALEFYRNLDLG